MKLLKGVVHIQINWKKLVCIFTSGCIESPEELSIRTSDNIVSLYCDRCGSLIRNTPIYDITNPEMLKIIESLLEE